MSSEMIRLAHPATKGLQETTRTAYEIRGGHRDKGWKPIGESGVLDDFPEERLRDVAAYWDVDLAGVEGQAEIIARLVAAPVNGEVDPTVPSVENPNPTPPAEVDAATWPPSDQGETV